MDPIMMAMVITFLCGIILGLILGVKMARVPQYRGMDRRGGMY